jgi:hypothetical protein
MTRLNEGTLDDGLKPSSLTNRAQNCCSQRQGPLDDEGMAAFTESAQQNLCEGPIAEDALPRQLRALA